MTMLDEVPAAVATVTAAIGPAVVTIGRDRRGTGVVIADGQVLTNAHNLRDRTTQVTFADGRTAQGEVVGADTDGDLAVLGVDTAGAPPAAWSDATATAGQVVFAAGVGVHGVRVTVGTVSAVSAEFRGPRGRRISDSLEHTAPLARGSSGGPLLDAQGAIVGINTHRIGDGFYLALAAGPELRARIDELAAGRNPVRRRLGISVAPAAVARRLRRAVGLPERDGLLVHGVADGSPAATAGVQSGDLVVSANAVAVADTDALWAVLDDLGPEPGATIEIGLARGAEELTVTITFDEDTTPAA